MRGMIHSFGKGALGAVVLALAVLAAVPAGAAGVVEAELDGTATNNSTATAELVPAAAFTVPVPPEVFDPPGYPTATVSGRNGGSDVDFFAFEAGAGEAYFDMDSDILGWEFDTILALYDSTGTLVAWCDDCASDPGSIAFPAEFLDSFIGVYTLPSDGIYYVAVSEWGNFPDPLFSTCVDPFFMSLTRPDFGYGGEVAAGCPAGDDTYPANGPQVGSSYTLHISLENPVVGFVCDDIRDLATLIRATDPGEFVFPGYQRILAYIADAAALNCDIDDIRDTVTLLTRIVQFTDGLTPPADWMIAGAAKTAIHDAALAMRDFYVTLLP